jgi:hypothetical protein
MNNYQHLMNLATASHHLEAYAAPLLELGVAAPRHLLDLEEEDVAELGMQKLAEGAQLQALSHCPAPRAAQGWGAQARRFDACIFEELQGVDRGAI